MGTSRQKPEQSISDKERAELARAEEVALAEKEAQAINLRRAGASYEDIARQLGYADPSGAYRAVQRVLRRTIQEPADDLRTLEGQRIERLLMAVWPLALGREVRQADGSMKREDPSLKAVEQARKLIADRRQLFGLDSPIPVLGSGEDVDLEEIAQQLSSEHPDLELSSVMAELDLIVREANQR